jgi:hypothetical protein
MRKTPKKYTSELEQEVIAREEQARTLIRKQASVGDAIHDLSYS